MICKVCGHQNADDSQYCSQCGLPLSIDDSLEDGQGERPVLSKVVPYVIPGQETGAIPVRFEDGSSDDSAESQAEGDLSGSEADDREGDSKAEPDSAGEADAGSSEPDRLVGPSGMVSWDREFPTTQITAVMPTVDHDEDEAEQQDPEPVPAGGGEPEDGVEASADVSVAADGDCSDDDADPDGADTADEHAEDAAVQADDSCVREDAPDPSQLEGESASNEDSDGGLEDPLPDGTEDDDEDDDGLIVVGRHGSSVDRCADTQRLERVPEPGPGSTAVIPSILKKVPARFSDADREKADAAGKFPVKWLKIAGAVLAVIALLVAVKLLVFNTEVPYVVDASSREARTRLESAGFDVQVESKVTDEASDGTVLSCDPACGSKQRKGSTVTLTIAASQTIPDVVGMDLESAKEMLGEQGATNIREAVEKSNQPENTVVSVSPGVGSPFNLDEEIVLTVATTAYMPSVSGLTQEEAKKTLEDAGYIVDVKWIESEKDPGDVVSTSPEANKLANVGSTVSLYVASPGPSAFMHVMEYFDLAPESISEYVNWKGFTLGGSFAYVDDWSGNEYVSQKWRRGDGATISFTPAPYIEDDVLDPVDYLALGKGFEGVRIYIPASSSESLGTDLTTAKVKEYMEACGLEGMSDSCTRDDLDFNGQNGAAMGTPEFICAQGTMNGKVWTILISAEGVCIGAGGYECYEDMEPICDYVAVNEFFQN